MTRLWSRWVSLLDRTESGESLALFRMACGICVLLVVGSVLIHDAVQPVWLDSAHGGYRASLSANWLVQLLGGVTPQAVHLLMAVAGVAGAGLVLGIAARVSALIAGQSLIALTGLNGDASGSYDLLLTNALWLLVLARSSATLSVSARLRHGRWRSREQVPAWPRYLVIFQMVAVYASTGVQKLSVHWTPAGGFSALYYILQQPDWQRFDMAWVASLYPLTQIGTALTWLWELTSPLLLPAIYFRATPDRTGRLRSVFSRLPYVPCFVGIGLTMHILTWILMEVGPFTWVMLAYYPCLARPSRGGDHGRRHGQAPLVPSLA